MEGDINIDGGEREKEEQKEREREGDLERKKEGGGDTILFIEMDVLTSV